MDQYADDRHLRARIELHRRFSVNPTPWQRWAFERTAPAPGESVLELGCGPGELWRSNLDRLAPSLSLTLTDRSPGMLAAARAALGARATYAVVDAQAIPYPDASFDLVVANHMLYHVPDRPRALAEIARVLRPGGRLCAATIGERHLAELHALVGQPAFRGAREFGLENGAAQLTAQFAAVRLDRYPDRLEVTEIEPVIAYLRSTGQAFDGEGARALVAAAIARDGAFRVTKDTGLFRATVGARLSAPWPG